MAAVAAEAAMAAAIVADAVDPGKGDSNPRNVNISR